VDRLIALVLLRFRLDLRALGVARERAVALAVVLPGMLLFSTVGAVVMLLAVRSLAASDPGLLLPGLSALATVVGLFWLVSPLVSGLAIAENHDVSRLMHFPIPAWTLVGSSLLANLSQPMVVAEAPMIAALAIAVAGRAAVLPLTLVGVVLSFAVILASAQVTALLLSGAARNRRAQDLATFFGIGLAFLIGLLPLALLWGGPRPLAVLARLLRATDLFALSPFAWGVRAAVHAGRGDFAAFGVHAAASVLAVAGAMALSAALIQRISRGELDLSGGAASAGAPARMRFGGPLGALVEKDVRMSWRDPALKATLFVGLIGPLLFVAFILQGASRAGGRSLLYLALFLGVSAFGNNAFGLERRGVALLMGFPVERWRILLGKNLSALLFRTPGLLMLVAASFILGAAELLPAAATITACGLVIGSGIDNYASVLFPSPHADPRRGATATRGGRGLGAMVVSFLLLGVTLLIAAPFVFLAWVPLLLGRPWLWAGSLPLALLGSAAVYAMLLAGAARLLERREPELMERMLSEG
jgi:ABC-2 type transport system permease protein